MDKILTVTTTVTPTNDAYTALDCVGGLQTIALTGAVINGGILNKVRIVDTDNEGAALTLWLFNDTPSTIADDAALALTAADLAKCFTMVNIATSDYKAINSLKRVEKGDLNEVFASNGSGNIYMYVQCVGTPTYASSKTLVCHFDILTEG